MWFVHVGSHMGFVPFCNPNKRCEVAKGAGSRQPVLVFKAKTMHVIYHLVCQTLHRGSAVAQMTMNTMYTR